MVLLVFMDTYDTYEDSTINNFILADFKNCTMKHVSIPVKMSHWFYKTW